MYLLKYISRENARIISALNLSHFVNSENTMSSFQPRNVFNKPALKMIIHYNPYQKYKYERYMWFSSYIRLMKRFLFVKWQGK